MRLAKRSSPLEWMRSARSRSDIPLSRSAAVGSSDVGSRRMSSGSSPANEKPRSLSASWIDESPRSYKIPSTPSTPSSSSASSSSAKFAWTAVRRPGYRLDSSTARATAAGSASSAMTRPEGCRDKISCVCPPAPKVASTIVASFPSAGPERTRSTLSSSKTGAWLVKSKLRHQIRHAVGRAAGLPPSGRRPHLDARQRADEHDVLVDVREVAQRLRHDDTALSIKRHLLGVREEMADEAPVARILARRSFELSAELRPSGLGVERKARLRRRDRQHEVVAQTPPQPGGNGQSALVVEGVFELSRKLRESGHRRCTRPHFEPLSPTILQYSADCKAFVTIYLTTVSHYGKMGAWKRTISRRPCWRPFGGSPIPRWPTTSSFITAGRTAWAAP